MRSSVYVHFVEETVMTMMEMIRGDCDLMSVGFCTWIVGDGSPYHFPKTRSDSKAS
jgi:hypothetical protein